MDQHSPQTSSGHQKQDGGTTTLNVPIAVLTNGFRYQAQRAHTVQDKKYLFAIVEGLGAQISQQLKGGGQAGSFNMETWLTDCGVDPQWGQIAA